MEGLLEKINTVKLLKKKSQNEKINKNEEMIITDELKNKLNSKFINPIFKLKLSSIMTNFYKNDLKNTIENDDNVSSFIGIISNKINYISKKKRESNIKKNEILNIIDKPLTNFKNGKKIKNRCFSNLNILKNRNTNNDTIKNDLNLNSNLSEIKNKNINLSQPHMSIKKNFDEFKFNNSEKFTKEIIMQKNIIKRNPSNNSLKNKKINFSLNNSNNIIDNIQKIKLQFGLYLFYFY